MSYHLDFLRPAGDSQGFEDVVRAAVAQPLLKRIDESTLVYDNPDTGVHFTIEANVCGEDGPPQYPQGFEYAGASFNLDLVRPNFFAHEAMPVITELARAAGLALYDPQLGAIVDDSQQLNEAWLKSNRDAISAANINSPGPRSAAMPHEKAMAYWGYQKDRARLAEQLRADDIFVPTLFLFRPAGSNEVQTALTWTADVYMIIPPSDFAVIVRPKKRWIFRGKPEVGYVSTAELMEKIGPLLQPLGDTGLQVITRDSAPAAAKVLNSIELKLGLSRFQRITADEFIDE